ncbi:MAG: hypothetical protein U0271_35100 [Polyangiaceae bacterium]
MNGFPSILLEAVFHRRTVVALAFTLLPGCAFTESENGGGLDAGGFGNGGNPSYGGFGGYSASGGGGGASPFTYSGLCGIDRCTPNDPPECGVDGPGIGGASGGAGGGVVAVGGAGGEGGLGMSGGGGAGGAGGAVGVGGSGPTLGCQVIDDGGAPSAVCAPSGAKVANEVCNTSQDCAPGLGCVLATPITNGEGGAGPMPGVGICRPYCCGDVEACDAGSFCEPQKLYDATNPTPETALEIPVCMPIETCQLFDTTCPAGESCTVVRSTGETGCAPVGEGQMCDPCPCDDGFYCLTSINQCVKLCDTQADQCPGVGGVCQGGGNLPDPIGVCVGGDATCTPL